MLIGRFPRRFSSASVAVLRANESSHLVGLRWKGGLDEVRTWRRRPGVLGGAEVQRPNSGF
jgi:hypothetical protein